MSKFVDELKASENGLRRPKISPIKTYVSQRPQEFAMDMPLLRGYDICTSYTQRVFCEPQDIDHMLKNSRRVIKEKLYGDFRIMLLDLERAVGEGDDLECRKLIKELLYEVFDA